MPVEDEVPATLWQSARNSAKSTASQAGAAVWDVRHAVSKRGKRESAAGAEAREGLLSSVHGDSVMEDDGDEHESPRTRDTEVQSPLRRNPAIADDAESEGTTMIARHDGHDGPHLTMLQLVGLMMHAFGYGLFYASVGVLLLPQEALHMFEEQHAIFLAVMLALAGVSQLVSPAAGYYSDRCTHRMGRRMPYILTGNLVLFLCLGAMFLARTYLYGYLYLALLLAAVISLNVAYTGFTGLVSDVVPSTQMGFASGVMGALTAAGAVTGLVFLGWLGESRLQLAYGVYAAAVLACTPFTYLAVRDKPLSPDDAKCSSSAELLQSYWISPHTHGDLFWVFVSRTFYYMAVSVQIYILYYLRDTMQDPEIADNAQKYTAILCVISQGASGVVAAVAGSMCSGFGRKPLIYFSCVAMAMVYVGYCFIASYPAVVALGVCYGASNGIYLAVDYALAVECLPNKDDHAKDLALWGIAAFLGTMFGPCISGPLLSVVGQEANPEHYSFRGYMALMVTGVVYSLICGAVVTRVRRSDSHMTLADDPATDADKGLPLEHVDHVEVHGVV